MSGPPPAPKRKRSSLHPGSWRGKRSRTNSRSGSPPDLDTSTPGAVNPHNAAQTATHFRTPSPNGGPATLGPYLSTSGVQDDTTLGRQGIVPASPVATPGHTPNQDTNETVWEALGKALGALHITAKICPPLHSAIDGLKSCLHIFEEAARTRKDYAELATGLTAMVDLLVEHMSVAVSKEITGALASVAKNITKEVELIKKRQSLNGPRRMLGVLGDDEDLVRRYRRIEQLFRQLQAEASMSTWNDTKRHLINTQLENLGPAKLAVFNSAMSVEIGRRSCTENTRTQILVDSMAWAESPDGTKIYWMNGMAGTGKTTIAYSLCERLEATGQLAASFFCTRMSRECSNAKRIIPTIAYQLAQQSALFRNALCEALDKNPDIGAFNTTSQFDSLLARPLMESRELIERNLVVVIDALDECDDPHAVEIVLDILFRYAADLPVKFFVTSRPEPAIRNSMMSGIAECNRPQSTLYLHEIEKSLVQADIELYLKDELKGMLPAHCADIEELAEQAGNLFIYAATAVRYIRSIGKSVNSRQRLKTILGVNNQSNKSMSTIDIDTLYYSIISAAIRDDSLEPDEQKSIQAVLWTAICACEPVLIDTLAALCDFDQTDVAVSALEPLYSVLHVSDHNHFVTTLHASFPNFMFSKERSQEFFCDKSIHDQFLARRCLDIMKAQLRFNICGLESSFILDDKIPDLKARVESRISLELFYASRFWVDHLSQGGAPSSLLELTYEFLSQRLLFWMEVLNLTKFMVVGAVASTKAHMWLRASDASPEMIALARDAQIFVGKYAANQVSESTPHIYLSALALSLPTSLIRSHYLPKFRGLVQAQGTFVERTDQAPLETWPIGSPARSVSFSVDRKHIVIGVDDGRVIVKNSHTGETILDFKAHHKAISSATFSNDGRLVVSSSHDCTICIWSALNGSLASGPFKGHSKQVNSVVFSPDDMRLASGAEDHTVRTWTTRDISASQILTGHTAAVRSVAFSPNGLQIASGSSDHTVRIWDALNGIPLHSLQGHSQSVTCVRFSLCGDFVFSGSHDSTIRMWDTHHGTAIGNPSKDLSQPVTSIAVSPEGERIASGSLDHTVRVWHRGSGKLVAGPFEGHTDSVRSVEFSADGACIVSASDDKSVRLWNAQGKVHPDTTDKPLEATADTVRCLEFINLHQTNDTEYLARGSAADVWKWVLWPIATAEKIK
ncbi:hypothetical protein FRC11_004383 [Ceratobasidium sp. 423]|nr:hypothetical protein FRC11_004383 [Ceratobasidium sp. 423]